MEEEGKVHTINYTWGPAYELKHLHAWKKKILLKKKILFPIFSASLNRFPNINPPTHFWPLGVSFMTVRLIIFIEQSNRYGKNLLS